MPRILDEKDREDMRLRIVRAAAAEFARIGFEQTKIEDIAERAGIGKGTVYLYFDSKHSLFTSMLQEIAHDQLGELKEALADKHQLPKVLEALFACFLHFTQEQPESMAIFISALFGVNRQFKEEAATQRLPFLKLIEQILKDSDPLYEAEAGLKVEAAALLILNTCQSLPLLAQALGFNSEYILEQQAQIVKMLTAHLNQK